MQRVMESIFDIGYLIFAISMGIFLIRRSQDRIGRKYGLMALILGLGDAFHLIPRVYALNTRGLEYNAKILGFGKAVTSISMTIFYLILYSIFKDYYGEENKKLDRTMYGLAGLRIVLSLLPQNRWLDYKQPLNFAIYRNIPFLLMGLIIIYLFYRKADLNDIFKPVYRAVFLSFLFYLPVVVFASSYPLVGLLMIPKTVAYAYIVYLGYVYYKSQLRRA